MALTTIHEVLDQLDAIVEIARARETADGFFAALYRRVTAEVAARMGLNEGSVRRILRALASRLARRRREAIPESGREA